jgi:flagellar basal body-associated protein FliL
VFVVFAVLVGVTNYGYNHVVYTSAAPASLFIYSILIAVLPYLLAAVISFAVFALSSKEQESTTEKEPESQEPKTQETEDLYR